MAFSGRDGQDGSKPAGEFGERISRTTDRAGGLLGGGMLWAADDLECAPVERGDARGLREKRANCAGFEGSSDDGQFGTGSGGDVARFGANARLQAGSGEREQADLGAVQHDECAVAV